jgi:hypothetical protein
MFAFIKEGFIIESNQHSNPTIITANLTQQQLKQQKRNEIMKLNALY